MTFSEAKIKNPRLRRQAPVGIIHSGGSQTVLECCLCGVRHTCATGYRHAKHVLKFREFHDNERCQVPAPEEQDALFANRQPNTPEL